MTDVTLLPPNRTAWETAIATVEAERPIPAHLVKSVMNPSTCPEHLLGYLAAALSVDVWDENWPEVKKREVCRDAFRLHRLKTTPAGIKAHVALTGAEVKRIIRPPAMGFRYAAMTEEARAAWMERLPQVRVYPLYRRSTAKNRGFFKGPGAPHQFRGVGWRRPTRGRSLYAKRATFYDQGVETEVQYSAFDGGLVEQIYIGGTRRRDWRGAGHYGRGYATATDAADNVVTIRTDESLGLTAIGRGVTPIDVRPQRVAQGRIAPATRSFFGRFRAYGTGEEAGYLDTGNDEVLADVTLGRGRSKRFRLASHAALMIYDKISLHDPDRIGARRRVRSFYGYGRHGIADFTAELRISVPMKRGVRRSGRWHGVGYRKAADMAPLRKAIEAVRVSKAFRDTVLIDTATHGQVRFSGGLTFGEFTFGEIKEVR